MKFLYGLLFIATSQKFAHIPKHFLIFIQREKFTKCPNTDYVQNIDLIVNNIQEQHSLCDEVYSGAIIKTNIARPN